MGVAVCRMSSRSDSERRMVSLPGAGSKRKPLPKRQGGTCEGQRVVPMAEGLLCGICGHCQHSGVCQEIPVATFLPLVRSPAGAVQASV